ncbi:Vacuolar protein-sorting-associated protein 27 [Dipsacomyces acuminosporus]|nr:Vacuolar protein-sorting-associated protein 27 [Dipsacomyces acuminosporus]
MVTRFFYGSPIEEDINRLTSEDVPNHELDISGALYFADKIRSKDYSAKEVSRTLRKRLEFPNPNVQILTLKLADICVKNGGALIQLEVSGREFVDAVVGLLDSKTGRDFELRQLILKLVQEWAIIFRGNNEMGYVNGVFERLKRSGYSFPAPEAVSSTAMVDTASAPEWEDSSVCQRCRTSFTFTNRKHHCRHCGKCFCQDCSSNSTPIPKFAIYDPVRVCHGCYLRLKRIVPDTDDSVNAHSGPSTNFAPASNSNNLPTKPQKSSNATPDINDDDEDLKRAIELSLKESQTRPNYADYMLPSSTTSAPSAVAKVAATAAAAATVPSATPAFAAASNEPHPLTSSGSNGLDDEEDDPDLRAAIEASLRDMPNSAVPDYMDTAEPEPAVYEGARELDFMPPVVVDEDAEDEPLTPTERENVQLFESLLTRIRDSGQDIRMDPQVQYLHESIQQLHPKIADSMDRVDQKHKEFIKLHDRIITAIKIYDQLLDKRLRSSAFITAAPLSSATSSYLPGPQSIYPALPVQQPSLTQQHQYTAPAPSGLYQNQGTSYSSQPQQAVLTPRSPAQGPAATSQHLATAAQSPAGLQPAYPEGQQIQQQQQQQPGSYQQLPPTVTYLPQPIVPNPGLAASSTSTPAVPFTPVSAGIDAAPQQPQHQVPQAPQPSSSPPTNPYYVPPAVMHAPSIPALQPTPATNPSAPAQQAAAAPAAASSPAPEEALLIEF